MKITRMSRIPFISITSLRLWAVPNAPAPDLLLSPHLNINPVVPQMPEIVVSPCAACTVPRFLIIPGYAARPVPVITRSCDFADLLGIPGGLWAVPNALVPGTAVLRLLARSTFHVLILSSTAAASALRTFIKIRLDGRHRSSSRTSVKDDREERLNLQVMRSSSRWTLFQEGIVFGSCFLRRA